jgi:hypothetical protein
MIPQQREIMELNDIPKVSIVLPLYNSAGEVAGVLAELDRQSYQPVKSLGSSQLAGRT